MKFVHKVHRVNDKKNENKILKNDKKNENENKNTNDYEC